MKFPPFGLMVRMYPKFIGLWKSFVICAIPATEPSPVNYFDHPVTLHRSGVGIYSLDYPLRFNADKIDEVIDLNLLAINKSKEGMIKIPLIAISLLEKHPNQMRWDENQSVWTFLDTFTGTRKNFSDDYMYYTPGVIEELKNDLGLLWNGTSWNWPEGFGPRN